MPTETDPTLTSFEVFLNGQRRATIVESLAEIADDDPRLPPQGLEERAGMKKIVAMLTDPRASLAANIVGEDTVYAPTAVRVLIAPATSLEPSSTEPTKLDWPLADLATAGEPVKGADGVSCWSSRRRLDDARAPGDERQPADEMVERRHRVRAAVPAVAPR